MSRVQIDKFKYHPQEYSINELINVLLSVVSRSLSKCSSPGLLLSGGVDSSIMAILIKRVFGEIECVTIGQSKAHPDLRAGKKIAGELGLTSISKIINSDAEYQQILKESNTFIFPGDPGVLAALNLCKKYGINDVIATDGIDEMMGGYWWHANKSNRFSTLYDVFEHFWNELDSKHLTPLYRSANIVGVNIHLPYLDSEVIDYISRIPLEDRVIPTKSKYLWKQCALTLEVPQWVIDRPKIGFVDALESIK